MPELAVALAASNQYDTDYAAATFTPLYVVTVSANLYGVSDTGPATAYFREAGGVIELTDDPTDSAVLAVYLAGDNTIVLYR